MVLYSAVTLVIFGVILKYVFTAGAVLATACKLSATIIYAPAVLGCGRGFRVFSSSNVLATLESLFPESFRFFELLRTRYGKLKG